MEREIKFRGICQRTGKWKYGYLSNKNVINTSTVRIKVIPESVGQFTGLKDKNGKDIYEGDILNIGTASFMRGVFGVYPKYSLDFTPLHEWHIVSREIVGNIHEPKKTP